MSVVFKKYWHQFAVTSFLVLVLFTYNNCGKTTGSKTSSANLNSKSMLITEELIAVGSPVSLLTYPGPVSPRIAFGDGRIVNNVHTAFPDLPNVPGYPITGWQLDQSAGRELMKPLNMLLNDPGYDSLLGKANWTFPTPGGDSHLKIYKSPHYGMVYEMFSKNGVVGPYGGAGLILGAQNLPVQKVNGKIKLDLDFRLSKVISSNPKKNPSFHWFALSGLYFNVKNPATGVPRSFLIQIIHANHVPTSEESNYKFDNGVDSPMLGGIVNSDLDKVFYNEMADFKHITLDINKYMCYATKQEYGSASGKVFTLPDYFKDPKNWSFSGYFFDLEHASKSCTDPNPIYGEACPAQYVKDFGGQLEIGVQVANINITQRPMADYKDVCQDYAEYNPPVAPAASMSIDGVMGASKTITAGQSVALKYESSGAVSCTLTTYINNKQWYQNVDFSTKHDWGMTPFNDVGTYKWDILCKNAVGQTTSSSAILNVLAASSQQHTASFYLGNILNGTASIAAGEKIDLRYESKNATSCTLTAYRNGSMWYQNVDFSVAHNWGKVQFDTAGEFFKWEVKCKNSRGNIATSSVTLIVTKPNVPLATFFINDVPNTIKNIKVGQSVNLRYESSHTQSCTLTGHIDGNLWYQNVDFSVVHNWGSTPFPTAGTYRWVINCKNSKGEQATASGQLNVKK